MKIRINQDIVEFTPENPAEKTELEALLLSDVNKTVHVKKGEVIPFCCGRLMEILD